MRSGKHIVLSDKREILLNDENDITLSIISDGKVVYLFPVSYPLAGYGGGTLLLSLSEKYLLFSYYSGQSEEAFVLFKIDDYGLESVYESGYLCGEDARYFFSNNENLLIQTLPAYIGEWCLEDNVQTDANGKLFFEYGEINILDIKKKTLNRHIFHVYPSGHWNDERAEEEPFYISDIVDDRILHVMLPWGEKEFALPMDDIITFSLSREMSGESERQIPVYIESFEKWQ